MMTNKIKCYNCRMNIEPKDVLIDIEQNASCPNCKHNLWTVTNALKHLEIHFNHRLLLQEIDRRNIKYY